MDEGKLRGTVLVLDAGGPRSHEAWNWDRSNTGVRRAEAWLRGHPRTLRVRVHGCCVLRVCVRACVCTRAWAPGAKSDLDG